MSERIARKAGSTDTAQSSTLENRDFDGQTLSPAVSLHHPADQESKTAKLLLIALAWIKARRARDEAFEERLFSDPAWDILLDLYVNHVRHKRVSISDLCLASAAPPTTALRYITILEKRKLIYRTADPADGRRIHMALTDAGVEKTENALSGAAEEDHRLGLGRLQPLN